MRSRSLCISGTESPTATARPRTMIGFTLPTFLIVQPSSSTMTSACVREMWRSESSKVSRL